eukprot:346691-Pelagomonas_calceolata.AAC.1
MRCALPREQKRPSLSSPLPLSSSKPVNTFQTGRERTVQHLSRPMQMLAMFAHRSNAKWVEARTWEAAHVHEVSNFGKDIKRGLSSVYKEQAIEALKAGKVVFQVRVPWNALSVAPPTEPKAGRVG